MIWLYNTQFPALKSFSSFEELCDYFKRYEQVACSYLDDSYAQTQKWDFVYHPNQRFLGLSGSLKRQLNDIEREACDNELDLIDVYTGDSLAPEQHIVTPNLNLEALMKSWVYDYAFAHEFTVLESVSGKQNMHSKSGIAHPTSFQRLSVFTNPGTWKEGA